MLYWQAPSTLNPHMTRGTKDVDASSLFYEQLLYIDADANFVPRLISEVPTTENGRLDPEAKWVIWKLKPGVQWHDGKPLAAEDVVFNWEYASDPSTAAITQGSYTRIRSVEKIGDLEVRVNVQRNLPWTGRARGAPPTA